MKINKAATAGTLESSDAMVMVEPNEEGKGIEFDLDSVVTVSYTHLDVYKRQMVTPRAGDGLPNLLSANTALRRALDLFAAVRPIRIKDKDIDWTFFRENIEGEYIWGDKGIQINEDLAVDFKVQTKQGSERIARAAFEFAKRNGKKNVTVVTKANIVKLVDGNFAKTVHEVGKDYPGIEVQERLVDAMCAKMLDPEFNEGIEVVVLPNLYGDIVTDAVSYTHLDVYKRQPL